MWQSDIKFLVIYVKQILSLTNFKSFQAGLHAKAEVSASEVAPGKLSQVKKFRTIIEN